MKTVRKVFALMDVVAGVVGDYVVGPLIAIVHAELARSDALSPRLTRAEDARVHAGHSA